ncbi:putative nucleoside-diphosphate-sugar epimerase [Thermanaerovibrio velox DSM 12556]|uniref:Putative nucleoside-diphosphate-sugar epimerase n=1 Tax=Thermanaerovibrio velox DSM 12556 TaxID=926567 RepID=H0UQ20_9BACT|nr:ELM1/GtrOC1 family putative glycosyltransferase [Thermanaerovibrio velox]EHM09649.1 putative nucleoside-diphosphate-sugar epimerase [Thermanaerovibrio velox DSM 12556]
MNQSRGVALWFRRALGERGVPVEVHEREVPRLSGFSSARARASSLFLKSGGRRKARDWLASFGGDLPGFVEGGSLGGEGFLILSAGSRCAPYNLALGLLFGAVSVTIMTPSVLGLDPFDYAIVPEHDNPPRRSNVFSTLGAPNSVDPGELEARGAALAELFPPVSERRWALLVGGDDRNYRVSPRWVRREVGVLLRRAEAFGADLYVTTSRRTSREAEDALERLLCGSGAVRMYLPASRCSENPVPGMLGLCTRVFCTEDSVSMVSEAVTAGHRVVLMRVDRVGGMRSGLSRFLMSAHEGGVVPRGVLFGPARFDQLFGALRRQGLLEEWGLLKREMPMVDGLGRVVVPEDPRRGASFNEARRSALWLAEKLLEKWGF